MKHTFIVAIDDGDCRYEYPLTLKDGNTVSIREIYKTLCKAYKVEPKEGICCPSKKRELKKLLNYKGLKYEV